MFPGMMTILWRFLWLPRSIANNPEASTTPGGVRSTPGGFPFGFLFTNGANFIETDIYARAESEPTLLLAPPRSHQQRSVRHLRATTRTTRPRWCTLGCPWSSPSCQRARINPFKNGCAVKVRKGHKANESRITVRGPVAWEAVDYLVESFAQHLPHVSWQGMPAPQIRRGRPPSTTESPE